MSIISPLPPPPLPLPDATLPSIALFNANQSIPTIFKATATTTGAGNGRPAPIAILSSSVPQRPRSIFRPEYRSNHHSSNNSGNNSANGSSRKKRGASNDVLLDDGGDESEDSDGGPRRNRRRTELFSAPPTTLLSLLSSSPQAVSPLAIPSSSNPSFRRNTINSGGSHDYHQKNGITINQYQRQQDHQQKMSNHRIESIRSNLTLHAFSCHNNDSQSTKAMMNDSKTLFDGESDDDDDDDDKDGGDGMGNRGSINGNTGINLTLSEDEEDDDEDSPSNFRTSSMNSTNHDSRNMFHHDHTPNHQHHHTNSTDMETPSTAAPPSFLARLSASIHKQSINHHQQANHINHAINHHHHNPPPLEEPPLLPPSVFTLACSSLSSSPSPPKDPACLPSLFSMKSKYIIPSSSPLLNSVADSMASMTVFDLTSTSPSPFPPSSSPTSYPPSSASSNSSLTINYPSSNTSICSSPLSSGRSLSSLSSSPSPDNPDNSGAREGLMNHDHSRTALFESSHHQVQLFQMDL